MTTATEPSEALSAPQPLSDATWSGDLGTLLPFLVGLIVVAGVPPSSILLAFGVSLVIVGLRFGVPMPVQPMKAEAQRRWATRWWLPTTCRRCWP